MLRPIIVLFSTLLALTLTGCATSPTELRKPENLVLDTEVDLNYQHLHRKLSECYNSKFSGSQITAQSSIHEQIYSDLGESELSQVMDGGFGRAVYMTTDLKKLAQEHTQVTVYVYYSTWRGYGEKIDAFLRTRPLDCEMI